MKRIFTSLLIVILSIISLSAAPLKFIEQTVEQPDGTVLHLYASGDEFYHWLHDKEGYTIIRNVETGYFVYATITEGIIVPTSLLPEVDNPANHDLTPWLKISNEEYKKRVEKYTKPFNDFWAERRQLKSSQISELHQGDLVNVLVFITFKDGNNFVKNLRHYNSDLNSDPVSMNTYYNEVSYKKLNLTTYFYPVNTDSTTTLSYTDFNTRNYYQPYNATTNTEGYKDDDEKDSRLQRLLKNALEHIADQVPSTLNIDKDKDGYIDNVSFVVQGNPDAWNDLIWPHRYVLHAYQVIINGAQARLYTFQMELTSVQTFCHEMFHMLGAPDLYHYDADEQFLEPVGNWDLMESGFGHMGAYMKYIYAEKTWITEMPVISASGSYSLHPLSTSETKNSYIVYPREQFNTTEYFVLEYRNKSTETYDKNLDGSGLLLYRINPEIENGNASGPPDELYLYRPNGAPNDNGDLDKAAMKDIPGYAVLDNTSMSAFLTDGTNSGLKISNVSAAGDSITFDIDLNQNDSADIKTFSLSGLVESEFDTENGVIYIKVERETNLESARPKLTISDFASVIPESNAKIDLTTSPYYTVTAEDGTEKEWKIEIDVLPNTEANITSFAFVGVQSKDYPSIKDTMVIVKVPYGTSLKNLIPTAEISIGATLSPDTLFKYDFTGGKIFVITSEDKQTVKEWNIDVQPDIYKENYDLSDLVDISTENGYIIIESYQEDLNYEVFSLNGSLIESGNLNGTVRVSVYGNQGVYLIRVKNEIGMVTGKVRVSF